MIRAAASVALALLTIAPAAADAGRARKPAGPQGTVAHWKALRANPPANPAAAEDVKVGLGTARAFEKQEALGAVKGRGVFTGKSKATGARKVTHLELVDELGDSSGPGMRIKSQDIDGEVDEPAVERFFRPVGNGRNVVRHESTDGLARFLLITGRGIFDYHGGDFEGDPEPGLAPEQPQPTPSPAP